MSGYPQVYFLCSRGGERRWGEEVGGGGGASS